MRRKSLAGLRSTGEGTSLPNALGEFIDEDREAPMSRLRKAAAWLLTLQLIAGALAPPAHPNEMSEHEATQDEEVAGGAEGPGGLRFRLSEGAEAPEPSGPRPTPAPAERLSEGETAKVLQRLPPLKAEAADEQEFALREGSLPAPRAGATVLAAFPAAESRPAPEARDEGPVRVLRYAPEGEVPLAPQLSVTFSRPMVAVTSQDEAAKEVPVRLTPQVAGRWRWLGTRTLVFDPEGGRLPMATEFQARVEDGPVNILMKRSVVASWTFATPPPKLVQKYPEGVPVRRDALMFVEFDQRVDPAAVLRTVRVRAGAAPVRLRLATGAEVNADENVRRLVKGAVEGRWLAFRAEGVDPLPADSPVTVSVGPGTPSAEGPRTTREAQSFSFRTYGPLRVTGHECGWQQRCTPFDAWRITFSNPLDAAAFDKSRVRIEPDVPGATIAVYGQEMHIGGVKRGRTTYRVTIDASLRDQFGQTLGRPATVAFNVGSADPSLAGTGDGFVVLDPSAGPSYSVYTINHSSLRVSVYAVRPEDWWAYVAYMRGVVGYYDERQKRKQTAPPGRLAYSKVVPVKGQPDEMTETRVDLAPALQNGAGHAFVVVEPTQAAAARRRGDREAVRSWVQVTGLALDAFVDNRQLVAWATNLEDGRPVAGAEVVMLPWGAKAVSGADGVARFELSENVPAEGALLVARAGGQLAMLPEQRGWWDAGSGWVRRAAADALSWYVFDDRKMYRPGEEVRVKGWVRRVGGGPLGDVEPLAGAAELVGYVVNDSRGNEVARGSAQLNPLGGFDAAFKLPANANLGSASLVLDARGGDASVSNRQHHHQFQVQEFRRPEFEVKAAASDGPHFVGGHATATVSAEYYAGGGLPDSEVNWRVTATPSSFTPPNRGDFTFGRWVPWWGSYSHRPGGAVNVQTFKGRTDAAGRHHLRLDFDSVRPPQPSTVSAQAGVTDVNRQTWTVTATMLVHPADLYVGMRSPRTFVQQGEPLHVETIVADLDGKLVAGRGVRVRAVLLEWTFEKGAWKQVESNPQDCEVRSGAEPVRCTFTPKEGGVYRVTARVLDDRERPNESELTLWVAGGKRPAQRNLEQERAELIPDRKEYRAGETAEILVQSPFAPAEGVLTLRRSGLLRTERFRMDGPSHTLRIPVEEGFTPNLHVQVDLVGAAPRVGEDGLPDEKLPKRPAFAKGELNLSVPPLARKLQVSAEPRDKALEPGGETVVGVEVRDAAGRPVAGSELAVVVVDESILALTGYRLADPLAVFYAPREAGVSDHHLRADVLLGSPKDLATLMERQTGTMGAAGSAAGRAYSRVAPPPPMAAPMARRRAGEYEELAKADAPAEGAEEIRLRENFNALAVFAPSVVTDAAGRAEVKVKVPDSLTRYRVMAVSVAGGKQFGSGESSITARMSLMVRPSAPRFLNFGDRFELPVVVQNQTDQPFEVSVGVRASNAELTEGAGRRVRVPANDRVEVRFPAAAERAGTARFQFAAVAGRHADAAQIELPVWTPATTEAFATYGELDSGTAVVQPVAAPPDVFPQFGGLEVQTSSTQLQALTDAVLYLVSYPFECSEQLSSRVLAVAALKDVLSAFKAEGMPSPEEMKRAVARDIERLRGMQNEDGGFGFWRRGEESWPYVSIHAAHALVRAREKGFDVPEQMLDRSRTYLRDIERRIPKWYGADARHALTAYALNVRARMGDRDAARARQLVVTVGLDKLPLEAVGWLLPVLSGDARSAAEVEAVRRHLNNRAEETAGAAHFTTSYGDAEYLLLHSSRRTDAVILDALITDQPASDLIPKVVRGLLAHRKRGRWENTQENVFVLLALDRYFNTYEKTTPDFVARAWLGQAYAGEQAFRGRSTERRQFEVPMRHLAERGGAQNLVISKEGAGRLYYRVGLRYAPSDLKLKAADYGFTVERVYEGADDAKDVRRDPDGTWRIRSGAKVRVRLTLVAPARRYHVALTDPLPAGLEALNPALAVTGSVPQEARAESAGRGWWWWRQWYEHQNLRDERAEAFASLLWEGVYDYTYFARATTPGAFVVPPPKAEEMYHPETFGRGATDRVVVE
ncbi:MAG TPA: alpha-2-macroglobulin family protein [Pyrinomonadaceae bacterium]|nr:alpha-2-macroglobulin family protein [Pyrinomonadaceae bacterium]